MNRFRQLDVLRALAVILVLGRHMTPCPPEASLVVHWITSFWARGGWVGVDLFFVLSGFLVSGLLFREYEKYSRVDVKRFLVRRAFKIYPPFWALIAFTALLLGLRHRQLSLGALVSELLFVQNYGPSLWNHTWSLAVEEHFYLLLAISIFALSKRSSGRPFRVMPYAFLAFAGMCLFLRIVNATHAPYDHKTHLFPSHLRLDGLFFGVVLSYYFHEFPLRFLDFARRFRLPLIGIGVLSLAPAFAFPLERTAFIYTYGLTLFYLASGCLVVGALGSSAPESRFGSAIAYIGSHSYSVYLWHMCVLAGAAKVWRPLLQHNNWAIYSFTYLAGAVISGILMALLIEFPMLRLRDRSFPSRGAPLSTDATRRRKVLEQTPSVFAS